MAKQTQTTKLTPEEKAYLDEQAKKKDVIKPIIRANGEAHVLETMWDGGELPELKSIGYAKMGDKTHNWVSYVITTKGTEVISIEISEPDMRAIAEEATKISFVSTFMDQMT